MLSTTPNASLSARARFISVEDDFNIKRPTLMPHAFDAERDRAPDPSGPSEAIPLDMSGVLMTPYQATTPLLLAKFYRLRAGDELVATLRASGEIYYVLRGHGVTEQALGGGYLLRRGRRPDVASGKASMPYFTWSPTNHYSHLRDSSHVACGRTGRDRALPDRNH